MSPLSHIKVLDLSRVLAGPWCGQQLADLGAEVIKVERPKDLTGRGGDDTRAWGPPYLRDSEGHDTTEAAYYLAANRGKRSMTINLASPKGQAVVRQLAAQSDVLIENYKRGQLAGYGLDYATLRQSNPRLVYCSITGFGQTGPYADRPGYDYIVQGIGGLMSVTGERDDRPGGGPQKVGIAIADIMTGMYSTVAILGALSHRDRTGEGQAIDMSLLDCQVAMLANLNMNYLTSGVIPQRMGNAHQNLLPYQVVDCEDGQMIIAVGNDMQFGRLCKVLEHSEWAVDERFASNPSRIRNREVFIPLMEAVFRQRVRSYWTEALEGEGIPCGPINNIAETFADPQVISRGLLQHIPHPLAGQMPTIANPIRYSGTPLKHHRHPPLLGEHTEAILSDLGYTDTMISEMKGAGVI